MKLSIKLFKDEYTLKFKRNEPGGTRICQSFRNDVIIEDSDPEDEAVAWFKTMCLQKNVSIGVLVLESYDKAENIVQKFGDTLQNTDYSLKIKSLRVGGSGAADLMWKFMEHCDASVLKELRVVNTEYNTEETAPFELFGKQDAIIKGLEKLEIDCSSIITDEVVSLSASVLFLKSENATDDMVTLLIEKFVNKREAGSAFCIRNIKNRGLENILPAGFSFVDDSFFDYKDYENYLENQPTIYLRVGADSVRLEVGRNSLYRFWTNNGNIDVLPRFIEFDSDSDNDAYDHFDDIEDDVSWDQYDYYDEHDILNAGRFSDFDSDSDDDFDLSEYY